MKQEGDSRRALYGTTSRRALATGAVAGAALFGGISAASASTTRASVLTNRTTPSPGGARPLVDGKVTAVGTGTFTVHDISGKTLTVNVDSATTYQEQGAVSASIADVKVGTYVDVTGTATGSVVSATAVRIETSESGGLCMSGSGSMPTAGGKITSVGTRTFTIEGRSGTSLSVNVSGTTTYEAQGVTSAGFSNVKVGEFAAVTGTETGSTVEATDIHLATTASGPGYGPSGPRRGGPGPGTGHRTETVSGDVTEASKKDQTRISPRSSKQGTDASPKWGVRRGGGFQQSSQHGRLTGLFEEFG